MMEETQFSLNVWHQLPEGLRLSALPMSNKEVAWEVNDALIVIQTFKENQIAVDGIEFFFFGGVGEPLQATSDIFAESKVDGESWQEFVSRSCLNAETFVKETFESEGQNYKGTPVFSIWATAEGEEGLIPT